MMKKLIVTEEEKKIILEKHFPKKFLNEQKKYLTRLFGNSVDDLFKMFPDEAVKSLDDIVGKVLNNSRNYASKSGKIFVKSASGTEVSLDQVKDALELVATGQLSPTQVATLLPRKLADGTEFRDIILSALETKGSKIAPKNAVSSVVSKLRPLQQKHNLKNCFSSSFCDHTTIYNRFLNQISETAKMTTFDPKLVRILDRDVIYPGTNYAREVLEVKVKDGPQFLIYKSSGSNVGTTGKKAGEWFVIPGWADDGWFFKTAQTIELTKGGNKYLTELAKFLEKNGSSALGQ